MTGLYNSGGSVLYSGQQLLSGVARRDAPAPFARRGQTEASGRGVLVWNFERRIPGAGGVREMSSRKADEYEICISGRKKTGADIQL